MFPFFILLSEVLLLSGLSLMGIHGRPVLMMMGLIAVFSAVYLFDLGRNERLKPLFILFVLGYSFRLFLLVFDLYGREVFILPNSGSDSETFFRHSIIMALGRYAAESGLVQLTGNLFRLIGISRIFVQFILMLCSVVALHMANRIMENLDISLKNRKLVMAFLCLLPNFAILSSLFLRESIVTMFIAISLYYFSLWLRNKKKGGLAWSIVPVLMASYFHCGAISLLLGYIVVCLFYSPQKQELHFSVKSIAVALVMSFLLVYLFFYYRELLFGKMQNLESMEDIAAQNEAGGSSYAAYAGNSNSVGDMILYTPIRIIMFLFSPMPWQIRGVMDLIAIIFDSFCYLFVVCCALKYSRKAANPRRTILVCLLLVALASAFVFGWGVSNTGTAIRHRDKMIVLYAVIWGICLEMKDAEKSRGRKSSRSRHYAGCNQPINYLESK